MIAHVVLLKVRENLTAEETNRFVHALGHALRDIPTVRNVRIGRRTKHGAGYEPSMPDAADYLAVFEFDDAEGLQIYLRHPAHAELGRCFRELLSSALVYDFELADVQHLEHLVVLE
jgi:hypothetical protein